MQPTQPWTPDTFVTAKAPNTKRPMVVVLVAVVLLTQSLIWGYLDVGEIGVGAMVFWTLAIALIDLQLIRYLRWIKSYDRLELQVNESGITVVNQKGTKSFSWAELQAVVFVVDIPGASPTLVIEPASLPEPRFGARLSRQMTGRYPGGTPVPLGQLRVTRPPGIAAPSPHGTGPLPGPPDDLAALTAVIRRHSDGRFPLNPRKVMPKHSPDVG